MYHTNKVSVELRVQLAETEASTPWPDTTQWSLHKQDQDQERERDGETRTFKREKRRSSAKTGTRASTSMSMQWCTIARL